MTLEKQPEDPYDILGLAAGAAEAEIRAAYFARVREHPPERDPEGFKRIREAYDQLRDPLARARLFLDRFEPIPLPAEPPEAPRPVPVPPALRLAIDPRCEVLRKDFSDEYDLV